MLGSALEDNSDGSVNLDIREFSDPTRALFSLPSTPRRSGLCSHFGPSKLQSESIQVEDGNDGDLEVLPT